MARDGKQLAVVCMRGSPRMSPVVPAGLEQSGLIPGTTGCLSRGLRKFSLSLLLHEGEGVEVV